MLTPHARGAFRLVSGGFAGVFVALALAACGGCSLSRRSRPVWRRTRAAKPAPATPSTDAAGAATANPAAPSADAAVRDDRGHMTAIVDKPWTGDFDGMVKRRRIRILTPYSRTHYFIDKGTPRGIVYEAASSSKRPQQAAQDGARQQSPRRVHRRRRATQLYNRSSTAAATSSPRPSPSRRSARNWWTSPSRRAWAMSAKSWSLRRARRARQERRRSLRQDRRRPRAKSIYEESLTTLNASFKQRGLAPVTIKELPGALEDEDILEMVNAGLVPATIVNDYIAEFWKKVFPRSSSSPNITHARRRERRAGSSARTARSCWRPSIR